MSLKQTINQLIIFLFIALISSVAIAEQTYRVRSADNINSIVERFYPDRTRTKAQIMVGLLVENPRAFKGGNINYLMRGRRLRLLDENELSEISQENAQEVLSQHTFYYREGVTGSDYLLPPVLGVSEGAVDNKKEHLVSSQQSSKKQEEQLQKINKLEKESNDLKKQLQKLLEERKATDKKLLELETTIKNTATGVAETNTLNSNPSRVLTRNKELEETNARLQQKLQESRSALAENTRSTITLERQVNTLKQKIKGEKSKPTSAGTSSTTASSSPLAQTKAVEKTDFLSLWSQYSWVLGLLLLLLVVWFLIKLKRKRDIERDDDYASQIAEIESNSFVQQGKNSL